MSRVLKFCESLALCFILTFSYVQCVESDPNKYFKISSLCTNDVINPVYRRINGALITSDSDKNFECIVTFLTDTVLQKFSLRFEQLNLDCDHHLYIYDGSHASGLYKKHLSCDDNVTEVGLILTESNFITLKYVTNSFSYYGSGFHLVITSFKEPHIKCKDYKCLNSFCISNSLLCDGINHCGDNSDESSDASCHEPEELGLTEEVVSVNNQFIIILMIALIVLALLVISLAIFLFYHQKGKRTEEQIVPNQNTSHSNIYEPIRPNFYGEY